MGRGRPNVVWSVLVLDHYNKEKGGLIMSSTLARTGILLAILAVTAPTHAAVVSFSGSVVQVDTDSGTGQLAGTTLGTMFTAMFSYPDSAGPSTIVEPNEADYELSGSASLTRTGGSIISGTEINVIIQDDFPLESDAADLINLLIGPVPPAVGGEPVDTWSISALQTGAFEQDPNPADGDDTELLFNGVLFEFVLLSLDDSLYDSLAYRPLPPGFGDVPVRAFLLTEADSDGSVLFEGIGLLDTATVVPAPAGLWLLLPAVAAIAGHTRRRRVHRAQR